jgi:hypothetical protein
MAPVLASGHGPPRPRPDGAPGPPGVRRVRREGAPARLRGHRRAAHAAAAADVDHPARQRRDRERLARRRHAARGRGHEGRGVRDRPPAPALALRPAERRRPGGRDERAAAPRRQQGPQGLVLQALPEEGGRGRTQREPHLAPARRRRRRRRGDADGLRERAQRSVRHGARRRDLLRREQRRHRELPLRARRDGGPGPGHARGRPPGRPPQPPLDEERRRERGRHAALCHRGLEQQRGRARHGGGDGQGGAPRSAWPGSPTAAPCGPRSTSATSWAATWCRTT